MTGPEIGRHTRGAMSRHSPIISPEALSAGLARPDLRIVDVRWVLRRPGAGRRGLRRGSPAGRRLPRPRHRPRRTERARPPSPPRSRASSASGSRRSASDREDEVVAYDDVVGLDRRSAVVDARRPRSRARGGARRRAHGVASRPAIRSRPIRHRPGRGGSSTLRDAWSNVVDRDGVAGGLGSMVLLDARATPRYLGEIEPIDRVAGAHTDRSERTVERRTLGPEGACSIPGPLPPASTTSARTAPTSRS